MAKEFLVGLGRSPESIEDGPCRVCRLHPFHSENEQLNYLCLGPEEVPSQEQRENHIHPNFMIRSKVKLVPKHLHIPSEFCIDDVPPEYLINFGFYAGVKILMSCSPFAELLETI